jgi:hypothetical protein
MLRGRELSCGSGVRIDKAPRGEMSLGSGTCGFYV